MRNLENAPRIYVGTYGQYNNGSLLGKWFDLTDYMTVMSSRTTRRRSTAWTNVYAVLFNELGSVSATHLHVC